MSCDRLADHKDDTMNAYIGESSSDDEEVIDYGDSDCDDNDHRESINIDVEGS